MPFRRHCFVAFSAETQRPKRALTRQRRPHNNLIRPVELFDGESETSGNSRNAITYQYERIIQLQSAHRKLPVAVAPTQ